MLIKILFWCAVLAVVIGTNSPDGNLFFFFAAHLTTVSVGLLLHRREKRGRARASAKPGAACRAGAAAKAKAA